MCRQVSIFGCGLAGLTSARLLSDEGFQVGLWGREPDPVSGPDLMLSPVSEKLIRDFWGLALDDFAYRLEGREVWEKGRHESVDQPAWTIPAVLLVRRLLDSLPPNRRLRLDLDEAVPVEARGEPGWTILATGRSESLPPGLGRERATFGQRCVHACRVEAGRPLSGRCYLETVRDAWLFLAPLSDTTSLLQVMLPEPAASPDHLAKISTGSHWLRDLKVDPDWSKIQVFAASPALWQPLGGPNWLAVGDAAAAFDPVCGDGSGRALQGALLAAASIAAATNGVAWQDCLENFRTRIIEASAAHLNRCSNFYGSRFHQESWRRELRLAQEQQDSLLPPAPRTVPRRFFLQGRRLLQND